MTDQPLLQIEGLKTHFSVREGEVRSVDGVDLTVYPGETVCIVGESGCGKSVTARSIMQLVDRPGRIVEGSIRFRARGHTGPGPEPGSGLRRLWRRDPGPSQPAADAHDGMVDLARLAPDGPAMRGIRGKDISMVFQEPMASLSPVHTIGQQLSEMIMLHERVDPAEAKRRAIEALDKVGLPTPSRRYDAYSFELSGGMRQRAMIAMAIACGPQLLIADEPTTALDVTTQRQILDLLRDMQADLGMAILFITHDLGVVAEIADRVAVMYLGMVVEECDVYELFESPRHPYTRALLDSMPSLDPGTGPRSRLRTVRGSVPHPLERPDGCPFVTRCDHTLDDCRPHLPDLITAPATDPTQQRARAVRCRHFPTADAVRGGVELDLGPLRAGVGAS